jgi:hypothetical protein
MRAIGWRSKIVVSADGCGIIGQGGAVLLLQTLRVTGLDRVIHDPGKIMADLAVTLGLAQLPRQRRQQVLIRTDSGGATRDPGHRRTWWFRILSNNLATASRSTFGT